MLNCDRIGAGPDLFLVHGWGLNGAVWEETAADLSLQYRVQAFDLPGYGSSPLPDRNYDLDMLADAVAMHATRHAYWVGWSLGGLVCLRLARRRPELVDRLVLVSSSPRMVAGEDWPHGIEPQLLAQFAAGLEHDFRGTLLRFLALEARGSDRVREELRVLRERVFSRGEPHFTAVRAGLELLRTEDLRAEFATLSCPVLVVLGERDNLVPRGLAPVLEHMSPAGRCTVIPGAAHAPFVSHAEEFQRAVREFLDA